MINALCTWGDGPDVLLVFKGSRYEAPQKKDYIHGFVDSGSADLTIEEAESLAEQLKMAAQQARQLDQEYEKAMRTKIRTTKNV